MGSSTDAGRRALHPFAGTCFFEPLRELAAVWHDKASGQAAVEALENLARGGMPVVGGGGAMASAPLSDTGPCVRVRSLVFGFPDERPLFTGLDLSIQPGEKIALVGPSGAGKTVVLSLLAGLLPPQSGVIEIGNQTLEAGSGDAVRSRIGWMGQRPHVFAGSVASNVALASNAADLPAIAQSVSWAGLEPVAQAHPSVLLGEGGVGLSGGEAARLALARLLAAPAKDLWLVDEPTAHLDAATASLIRQALLDHSGRRTLVVATHDPALIARMDRVIMVGDASVVVVQGKSDV
ncbi:ATP-binding cassette domain-containing protein [Neopusillimonas aromaticivorans]|uniref:ATP-binding cassette domain-containing protein n=1 Tax=Neopusillimonas aromaticivorans TaxID=2979868 RepID=UPI003315F0A0